MKHTIKTNVGNRLKRIEGQVRGLQRMVVEKKYCIDIITQSSAIRNALASVEDLMLQNHLEEHVVHQMKHGKEGQAAKEILKVYKLKRK